MTAISSRSARRWGEEEIQHGKALARWAELADPEFDFEAAFGRFRDGYQVDFDCDVSRRGSRTGEMIARCMVEVGTSSYYSALRDGVQEPVLKEICRNIAADEIRHYKLFYSNLTRCLERERGWLMHPAPRRRRADCRNPRMTNSPTLITPRMKPSAPTTIATLDALMRGAPTLYAASIMSRTAWR